MTITAFSGPVVSFGSTSESGVTGNPERGPSLLDQGAGLLDPRSIFTYTPGQDIGAPTYGFLGTNRIPVLDVAAATKATAAIAAAAHVATGVAMTLVSADGAGIVVSKSVVNYATGATVTGLLCVDQVPSYTLFGSTVRIWNPATLLARAASITGSSSATGGDFLIAGYDIYGQAMTETITHAGGTAVTLGKKAFKFIASVTPQFTDAHNYSVDTTDVFGFALRSDYPAYATLYVDGAVITATTGFVAADTTSPATATTGDVRGTYALQTASDGTKRQAFFISPSVATMGSTTGLFGVVQA